jgi:maleamate amidohydrolase
MAKRVWDDFLTARDKASLGNRPEQIWGYGKRPALILIDLHRWVFGDRRQPLLEALQTWPGSCGEAGWDALPHIQRLLEAARSARIPIVHLTGLDPKGSGVAGWTDTGNGESVFFNDAPFAPEILRNRFDIIDEVAPREGEAVLRKSAPSAFFGTPLLAHLQAHGADSLLVGGETTSGCVRATCIDGRSYRFRMTVVEECVFDRHEAAHAVNLFDLHQKYADVMGVDDVAQHLLSLP